MIELSRLAKITLVVEHRPYELVLGRKVYL